MRSRAALRVLAEVSESQWGMVTTSQARARGVSHMSLTRLTASGDLVRLAHGVYRDAGTPSSEHEELRAAWLGTDPAKLAYERLREHPKSAVVAGESACKLHDIGDLRAMKSEFATHTRRQTQRSDVHYRTRPLPEQDITVRHGLPVTTRERTVADLVEDRHDLSIVGDVLRDAARQSRLDVDRLAELLSPLAERNGLLKGDGDALLEELLEIAGIDLGSLARQLSANRDLSALVTARYLDSLPKIDPAPLAAALDTLAKYASDALPTDIARRELAKVTEALSTMALPMPDLRALNTAITSFQAGARAQLAEQLSAIDWTAIAEATQPSRAKELES